MVAANVHLHTDQVGWGSEQPGPVKGVNPFCKQIISHWMRNQCAEISCRSSSLRMLLNTDGAGENAIKQAEGRQTQCFDGSICQLFHY